MSGAQHYYYLRRPHQDPVAEHLVEEAQRIVSHTLDPARRATAF